MWFLAIIFFAFVLAVPVALVMAVGFGLIFQNSFEMFMYFLVSGTMAAYWLRSCRERKTFIIAGTKLGLLNIVLATANHFYTGELSSAKLIWDWAFAFLGGISAGIVTAGIVPLVEIAFDYTPDITLLELAHLDRPIMRRLMIEAPGTYHHSMIVGSMVEAAASDIGANGTEQAHVVSQRRQVGGCVGRAAHRRSVLCGTFRRVATPPR